MLDRLGKIAFRFMHERPALFAQKRFVLRVGVGQQSRQAVGVRPRLVLVLALIEPVEKLVA